MFSFPAGLFEPDGNGKLNGLDFGFVVRDWTPPQTGYGVCDLIQAEDGVGAETFIRGVDGDHVYLETQVGSQSSYEITVSQAGDYQVTGMVYGVDWNGDSVLINLDSPSNSPDWHFGEPYLWLQSTEETLFNLSQGTHTLYLANREDGARADWLRLVPVSGC